MRMRKKEVKAVFLRRRGLRIREIAVGIPRTEWCNLRGTVRAKFSPLPVPKADVHKCGYRFFEAQFQFLNACSIGVISGFQTLRVGDAIPDLGCTAKPDVVIFGLLQESCKFLCSYDLCDNILSKS